MKIIGITGKMGAGKDTVAAAMIAADPSVRRIALADSLKRTAMDLFDLSYEQVYGSQAQKAELDPRWGKSPREILQVLGTEVGRSLNQDVWVRRMVQDMKLWEERQHAWMWTGERWNLAYHGLKSDSPQKHPIWVVPDVRFPNEAAAIREAGGVILKVRRFPQRLIVTGGAPYGDTAKHTCPDCGSVRGIKPPPDYAELDSSGWHLEGCPHAHPSERGVEEIEPDYTFSNDIDGLGNVAYWAEHYLNRAKAERGWSMPVSPTNEPEDYDFQVAMNERDARLEKWKRPCSAHADRQHQTDGIDYWTCRCGARKA